MKRTASTLLLLAGLGGGGCVTPTATPPAKQQAASGGFGTVTYGKQIGNVQGPLGEPVMATAARGAAPTGVVPAGGTNTLLGNGVTIRPASAMNPTMISSADGCTNCAVPGVGGSVIRDPGASFGYGPPPGAGALGYNPTNPYGPQMPRMPKSGILPVPGQGPPGAVATGPNVMIPGMGGPGMGPSAMSNGRSSINFTGPAGMKVTWQLPDGSFSDERDALTAPKEYNFLQAQVYRLRLTSILPDFPGRSFYPTLEVAPATPKTLTFLAHASVPITFSADDFAQARAGNLVVKVVYLPDPANQDFSTVFGAEEVVSTRLEPGADPVAEAQRRGTILAVIRMGNIDLENRISPAMTAPPPGFNPGGMMPAPRPVPAPGSGPMPPKTSSFNPSGPSGPANPPGTATVKAPAAPPLLPPVTPAAPVVPLAPSNPDLLAPLPPTAPTDLPPAPLAPLAPGPKTK
jgi:hypothetical protein